jgi:hypothetical protein
MDFYQFARKIIISLARNRAVREAVYSVARGVAAEGLRGLRRHYSRRGAGKTADGR